MSAAAALACTGQGYGDHGPAVALISTGCVHEHVRTDVPCCADCVAWAQAGLCCKGCHELPGAEEHCCPLTLAVRDLAGGAS